MRLTLIAIALVGCGSSGNQGTDAPEGDARQADAGPDAPAVGLVTVTVTALMTPVPGAAVVFADASGNVIATQATGADGRASEMVAAGGSVTCDPTFGVGTDHVLQTVFDVQPGDQITCGSPGTPNPTPTAQGTVQFTLAGAVASATQYVVDPGGCTVGSLSTPVTQTLSLTSRCLNPSDTYDVVAVALDVNHHALAYAVVTD